ncbi:unnamed protein product [Caenorhabditis nigoni]
MPSKHSTGYGNEFLSKTGLGKGPQALLNGYSLDLTSSSESFDAVLFENIQKQTLRLQFALYQRLITDSVKIDEFWLKKETNPDLKTRNRQSVQREAICGIGSRFFWKF